MEASPRPMSIKKRTKSVKRKRDKSYLDPHPFRFPYFAHQQLDPSEFPVAIGLPVGRPGWAPVPEAIADSSVWKVENDLQKGARSDSEVPDVKIHSNLTSSVTAVQNPYKKLKTTGGRPALAKKVTADLDSDDEIIVRMKQAKYLEKDIAQRLVDEGRIRYNAKTIGTRWARLRRKLQEQNDKMLDAEETDWHDGDDEALEQAKQSADKTIERLLVEVESKRWGIVADKLKTLKPVTNFSQNACKARYESLRSNTAKPTPESLEKPDEHTRARIAVRKEKEAQIERDRFQSEANIHTDPQQAALIEGNLGGNAWTSKSTPFA